MRDDDLALPVGTRLLHIGPHKTGTTSLQGALWTARPAMREQGVRHAGATRNPSNAVRSVTGQSSPYSESEPPPISHWEGLVREVSHADEARVVVSSEFFAWADADTVRRIVADIGADRVHVVVTLRPLAKIIPSMWQQNIQAGQVVPFDEWLRAILRRRKHGFWTLHRHDALIARWVAAVGVDRVTAIVADDRDHAFLPRTFERLLALREGTLAVVDDYTNRSLTVPEVEAVRAFNVEFAEQGLSRAVHARMMRFGAAQLMKRRTPPAEEPRVELPEWADARVIAIASEIVAGIEASGIRIIGDLSPLTRPVTRKSVAPEGPAAVPPEVAGTMAMGILIASGRARDKVASWGRFRLTEPVELARMPSRQLIGYVGLRAWRSISRRLDRLRHPSA